MEKLEVTINDDVMDVIRKIRSFGVNEIILTIPEHSVIFENALNLKLIRKEAARSGKTVSFETTDEVGKNLIELLDPAEVAKLDEDTGFISQSRSMSLPQKIPFKLSTLALPAFPFPKFPKGKGLYLIIAAIILGLLIGSYFLFWFYPHAKVELVVNSSPLVKSVTVKLSPDATSVDARNRLLPGRVVESTSSITVEADATGEKIVGEKAKGEVTIVNKTDEEKKFKKGTILTVSVSKETLKFTIDADVTIPKKTTTETTDGITTTTTTVYGKANATLTASDIGSKYNISDDKTFKISGYDSNDFSATNDKAFTGGTSKKVKAVSQDDQTNLATTAFTDLKSNLLSQIKAKITGDQKLLESTVTYKKAAEIFSKAVSEEATKFSVTQSAGASGLYYVNDDLQKLLDDLLLEFIPEGFELSKRDSNIEVGVLDIVDPSKPMSELNLEVKIKAFIIPKVDENEIKANLKGASIEKAKDYLGNIKNIESYKIDIWPKITSFLKKFPGREDKIEVVVTRQ